MTAAQSPPIGILAGNGSLPLEVARAVTQSGGRVQVVAIDPGASPGLDGFPCVRLGIGQIGGMLKALKDAGCRDLVILGGVSRPDLGTLRPDLGLIWNLPQVVRLVFSGGDDGVLRICVRFFEAKGLNVVSPAVLVPSLVAGAGSLTDLSPKPSDIADILLGSSVVKALGAYDIGQAVVVAGGRIEAIEAAEGTDRMLARLAHARHNRDGSPAGPAKGVLIKRPKPGQEMRVDLPAIGPATVASVAQAGLGGIAVLAGHSLVAQRSQLCEAARAASIYVYGFTEGDEAPRKRADHGWIAGHTNALGHRHPGAAECADIRLGAAALSSIAALARSGACVVSRGHILGLETGGEVASLVQRSKRVQQWGIARLRRRVGVAVLAENLSLDAGMVAAAAAVRLSGIALMGTHRIAGGAARAAAEAGLFLVRITPATPANEHRS